MITEHIFELSTVAIIIEAMGKGEFRDRTLLSGPLDPYFLDTTLLGNLPATPAPPPLTGGYTGLNIIKRIMWTMGTTENPEPFVVAESSLNTRKMVVSAVWFSITRYKSVPEVPVHKPRKKRSCADPGISVALAQQRPC